MENMEGLIMNLVVDAGNARSHAMEAIFHAKEGEFAKAEESIKNAYGEITKAHHTQTDLIQKEAAGEKVEVSLLMVHAQDHLMTGMVVIDLANEMVDLYKKALTENRNALSSAEPN